MTHNPIWTFFYNKSTLNYLQIKNLKKWKRAIISLLLLRLLFGLWNCILESSSLLIRVHSSIVLNVSCRQACCNTELKRLELLKHVKSRFMYLLIKPIWIPICGFPDWFDILFHSFIHSFIYSFTSFVPSNLIPPKSVVLLIQVCWKLSFMYPAGRYFWWWCTSSRRRNPKKAYRPRRRKMWVHDFTSRIHFL